MAQRGPRAQWSAQRVKALRSALALSQRDFARQLGVRQQTISEWETGVYAPRGASARLLDMVAERGGVPYGAEGAEPILGHGDRSPEVGLASDGPDDPDIHGAG